jgi:hypothetical protein
LAFMTPTVFGNSQRKFPASKRNGAWSRQAE